MDDVMASQDLEVQRPLTVLGSRCRPLTRKVQPAEDPAEAVSP